ncbi:hypothetical protein [Burkholderia pyrrocinia]|nr:hypothetical protein [Burkholderia pyrrocinia]
MNDQREGLQSQLAVDRKRDGIYERTVAKAGPLRRERQAADLE